MIQQTDYLDQLNEPQRAAVEYNDGPSLVIAGAGSGKTRVLTYKIVHLLRLGVEPYRILALTFTNKAAREMRTRIENLVGEKVASKLWMGTFHSVFSKILHIHADRIGYKNNFTIYDDSDSKSLLKSIIKDLDLDDKIYKPSIVHNTISMAKNALMSPDSYAADKDITEADRRARRPRMAEVYRIYQNRCFVAGAMDFDDLLYYTNVLLRDNPDIVSHYQEFFKFILVDEYQDTNFSQHLIVSRLAERYHRVCAVGDDAQSIYSFRGANIRNILNLKNAYPELRLFKLEQNYRSTQTIINAANSLISKNKEQIKKTVFSKNKVGDGIEVAQCYSDLEEAFVVVNRLRRLRRESGDSLEEFAILYRTNAQSRALEEQLRKANVSYRIYGGLSFYQRKEIKDAIAYMRVAVNPDDDEALKRIINFPARGIGDTTIKKLQRAAIDNNVSIWDIINTDNRQIVELNSAAWRKLDAFAVVISSFVEADLNKTDAYELAKDIIDRTGLISMLVGDNAPENITRYENLMELLNGVKEFVEERQQEDPDADVSLTSFLSEISLATDQDRSDGTEAESVTLMTVHASKGLEFNNIFIVGVEDDLFPSAMSKDSISQIEEERRLLYVAITRARNFCMMSYARSRFRNGATVPTKPSPFLYDIDRRSLRFMSGTELSANGRHSVDPIENYRRSFHSQAKPAETATPSWREKFERPRFGEAVPRRTETRTESEVEFTLHSSDDLTEGMTIEHTKFGKGEILLVDRDSIDHRIKVAFGDSERTLLLKYARFKILS